MNFYRFEAKFSKYPTAKIYERTSKKINTQTLFFLIQTNFIPWFFNISSDGTFRHTCKFWKFTIFYYAFPPPPSEIMLINTPSEVRLSLNYSTIFPHTFIWRPFHNCTILHNSYLPTKYGNSLLKCKEGLKMFHDIKDNRNLKISYLT